MSQIVGLINGAGNLNRDYHYSLGLSSIINAGVITGLELSKTGLDVSITSGEAVVPVTRTSITPNESFCVAFISTATETITVNAGNYIIIEVTSDNVNDASLNTATTGTGIGEIKSVSSLPSNNYIILGQMNSGGTLDLSSRNTVGLKSSLITTDKLSGSANKILYTDGTGKVKELAFGNNGQVLGFTGTSSAPVPVSPSVDIGGLIENTNPSSSWFGIFYNGTSNLRVSLANLIKGLGYATKSLQGVIRIATDSEANNGTSDDTAITPKQSKIKTAFAFQTLSFSSGGSIGDSVTINHNMGVVPRLITVTNKTFNYVEPSYCTGVATYDGTTINQKTTSYRSGIISGIASFDTNDYTLDPAYRYVSAITSTSITLTRGNNDNDGEDVLYLFTFIG